MDAIAERFRRDFPYLNRCAYLDTATTGLTPPGQGQLVAAFYDKDKIEGTDGKVRWLDHAARVRARLADLLCVKPETIYFLSNTTEALNLIANSISWRPGDEVAIAADEHSSVLGCWHVAAKRGGRVAAIPIANEDEREDRLLAALGPRTRVMALSHVHFCTGTRLDLQRLGAACRTNGTLLAVDGIQSLGAIPIPLATVDFFCAGTFKWLLGGYGLAILIVSDQVAGYLSPAYRGHANQSPSLSLQYSHLNFPGIYALEAALDYLDIVGWQRVWDRVEGLVERLTLGLEQLGYAVTTPSTSRAGIISFSSSDVGRLFHRMIESGARVAERKGMLRVSPHFYNSAADIDRVLEVISDAG